MAWRRGLWTWLTLAIPVLCSRPTPESSVLGADWEGEGGLLLPSSRLSGSSTCCQAANETERRTFAAAGLTESLCMDSCLEDPDCLALEIEFPTKDLTGVASMLQCSFLQGKTKAVDCVEAPSSGHKHCFIMAKSARSRKPTKSRPLQIRDQGPAVQDTADAPEMQQTRGRLPWHLRPENYTQDVFQTAVEDIKDVLNMARGGEVSEPAASSGDGVSDLSPRAMQQIRQNTENDLRNLASCLVFNLVFLAAAALALIVLSRIFTEVYSPRASPTQGCWASDEELLAASGLDGLMLVKFLRMGLWVCVVAAVFNVLVLAPAHLYRSFQVHELSFAIVGTAGCEPGTAIQNVSQCEAAAMQLQSETTASAYWTYQDSQCLLGQQLGGSHGEATHNPQVDLLSDANAVRVCRRSWQDIGILERISMKAIMLEQPSPPLLWLDTISVVVVTCVTLYALQNLLVEFYAHRQLYLHTTPARSTVLVEKIPNTIRDGGLEDYFQRLFPRRVHSVHHARRESLRPLAVIRSSKLERWTSTGFVTFSSIRDAQYCAQVVLSGKTGAWKVRLAPEPEELLWSNISSVRGAWGPALSYLLFWILFFFWSIPVGILSTMANLQFLESLPGLEKYVVAFRTTWPTAYATFNGSLGAATLMIFMSFLPCILESISRIQLHIARRFVDHEVEKQYFYFCLFYVVLANAISQSLLKFVNDIVANPPHVFGRLADALPQVSTWYMSYIMFALAGFGIELLRPYHLLCHLISSKMLRQKLRCSFYTDLPESIGTTAVRWTLYLAITLIYSSMMPLILLLMALIIGCGLMMSKYQLMGVYKNPYDTGGLWVPVAVSNVQLILTVYQVAMLGLLDQYKGDTLQHSLVIFLAMCLNFAFYRQTLDASYEFVPLDADLEVQEGVKAIGTYRPPAEVATGLTPGASTVED